MDRSTQSAETSVTNDANDSNEARHLAVKSAPWPTGDAAALERHVSRLHRRHEEPWLHAEVARRMGERLALFRVQPRTLVQWWGPSAGDPVLRTAYPAAAITVARPAMAARAQGAAPHAQAPSREGWWRRFTGRAQPEPMSLSPTFDDAVAASSSPLLWANMVLHAAPDVAALIARWHAALEVEGLLMFSTFGPDTLRELRDLYRDEGFGPYGVAPIDMHDIGDALVHAGFADPVMDQERVTLHWGDPRALLDELRALGINASPARHAGLRTPRWLARLHDALRARSVDGRIALTFEVVYGHAFKVAPRVRGTSSHVAVDDLAASLPSRQRAAASGRGSADD